MKPYPFHFSFLVKDLESTRAFYRDILGCKEGRSTEAWVDFDLFGNQISAHVTSDVPAARHTSTVDGVAVPMPHFGCIVAWDALHELAGRLKAADIPFIIAPTIRFQGEPGEQATMFLKDFSGNALEFKSFKNPEHIFTAE